MQGHVYLNATQLEDEEMTRIAVECELKNVGVVDKFKLLDALCQALNVSRQEWLLYVVLRDHEV